MRLARAVLVATLLAVALLSAAARADDPRYINGPIVRAADGTVKRSSARIAEFRREHPCPATGLTVGSCAGWQVDHVIPLICGGYDSVFNMQWLPVQIKSAAGAYPKDRWEQRVYCRGSST